MSLRPILVMAGGTGGHVYPALAVARALQANSREVVWLGTQRGLESRVIPAAGIEIEWISVQGLRRKGVLALFLLEMGLIAASQTKAVRESGLFIIAFGVLVPVPLALIGALLGWAIGLSVGGTTLLAVLAGSASYIAAPAAIRIAVPEANPSLSLTASLGVTFPFNIFIGIPIYYHIATVIHGGVG